MHLLRGLDAGLVLGVGHLLVLPDAGLAETVPSLVRRRHPAAAQDLEDDVVVVRPVVDVVLRGPYELDAPAAEAAGVPPGRPLWQISSPRHRQEPPLPGTSDRDGLHRAFPDGLPDGVERRGVDLGLSLARRLGGALRVAPSGVLLEPDPMARIDRVLLSPSLLAPEQALQWASAAVPAAQPSLAGSPWRGLSEEAVRALEAPDAGTGMSQDERARLHLAADRADARALAEAPAPEGYALLVALGEECAVEVRVGPAERLPDAVAGQEWAGAAVAYGISWWPDDEAQAESEHLSARFRAARREAAAVVEALSGALAQAAGGVVVDADGYPVR